MGTFLPPFCSPRLSACERTTKSSRSNQVFQTVWLACLLFWFPALANADNGLITVGVFTLFRPNLIEVETGPEAVVSMQNGATKTARVLVEGQRLRVEQLGDLMNVKFFERDGRLLSQIQAGSVRTQQTECTLSVPGRIRRTFVGGLEVDVRRGRLLSRVHVPEDAAVEQILRSEMAEAQEPEALKAQAILVRSYLRVSGDRHPHEGYRFCDTTHCQFFAGHMKTGDRFGHAAQDSQGLILTFLGKPFQPMYTAACGGRTLEGPSGGGRSEGDGDYPYHSVVCNYCAAHPLFTWQTSVTKQELLRALQGGDASEDPERILARLAHAGDELAVSDLKQRMRIRVGRRLGWNIIRSNRYAIETTSNSARIKGHGSGHNLGLCQAGAIELAKQGKSTAEILSFYFPGSRIAR